MHLCNYTRSTRFIWTKKEITIKNFIRTCTYVHQNVQIISFSNLQFTWKKIEYATTAHDKWKRMEFIRQQSIQNEMKWNESKMCYIVTLSNKPNRLNAAAVVLWFCRFVCSISGSCIFAYTYTQIDSQFLEDRYCCCCCDCPWYNIDVDASMRERERKRER